MLPESFLSCLGVFDLSFSARSYARFLTLLRGWVLCVGKHTVTGVMRSAGVVGKREHGGYHRFFSRAKWETDGIGLALLGLVVRQLVCKGSTVLLSVDDTLARHTGKRIAFASMHRDPLLSTGDRPFFHFGHMWVVVCVVIYIRRWDKSFSLPVLVRLYRSKKANEQLGQPHRKKTELASELLTLVSEAFPKKQFLTVGDNAYVNRSVFRPLKGNMNFVGRGRMDAALYKKAPAYSGVGRPRVRGEKVASPRDRRCQWKSLQVLISGRPAVVKVRVFRAVWYRVTYDRLALFVVVRGWPGHEKDDVLVSTDLERTAEEIIVLYQKRWSIEETFGSVKGKLGFEDPQNRTERAVERTAPMALWTYTLVVLWYIKWSNNHATARFRFTPWYPKKQRPSFADMLATLRRQSWTLILSDQVDKTSFDQNSLEPLLDAVSYA